MRMYYTYLNSRASDGKVFYIGKGKDRRAWAMNKRSKQWSRVVAKHGLLINIAARWETEEEAFSHERLLIQTFRDMGLELANHTDGGDGTSGWRHAPETIAKIKASNKGKRRSPESVANAKATRKASMQSWLQEYWTPERRKAASDAVAGERHPNFGKKRPPELCAKLSVAHKGRTNGATSKPVVCVDTGETFPSAAEAARKLLVERGAASVNSCYIAAAARGQFKTAYGLQWRLA